MEFKGTKGKWTNSSNAVHNEEGKCICITYENIIVDALLISKAPEMLEMLQKAKAELSRIKGSMMAHPDCIVGSEFDDYTSTAQECENEIELLIREATEL